MPITKTTPFLPAQFQSDTNKKFLNATLDQLVTESNVKPISGYVGRKFAPGDSDITKYIREPDSTRANYQLEPGVVVRDPISNDISFTTSYPEFLQKLNYLNSDVSDPNKIFGSEFYSYNPNVDLDKFVNFGQYYWLPDGPDLVQVYANAVENERTYYPLTDTSRGLVTIDGFGQLWNPQLTLARGGHYKFKLNQPGHKFWIQTDPGVSGQQSINTNFSSREVFGVTNNGIDSGIIEFTVPARTDQQFYSAMPVVRTVDLATTYTYAELQGANVTDIIAAGGIDGQISNLDGKYIIFVQTSTYSSDWWTTDSPSWTTGSVTEPIDRRYGVWQIKIAGGIITLLFVEPIPISNKVIVLAGTKQGNTQWYTQSNLELTRVPVITATLDTLYYQIGDIDGAYGTIKLVDAGNNIIDISSEILGKTQYRSPNGVTFTNGLKVQFDSYVVPTSYQNGHYYVEGVGTGIRLVSVDSLVFNPTQLTTTYDISRAFTDSAVAEVNKTNDGITITIASTDNPKQTLTGNFPNSNTKYQIINQEITYKYPYRACQDTQGIHDSIAYNKGVIGMTVVGIPIFAPSSGIAVPGDNNTTWTLVNQEVKIQGQDQYGGTVNDTGEYYYVASDFINANAWAHVTGFTDGSIDPITGHSRLIGVAADGYPIYGPWGFTDANIAGGQTSKMTSSYVATNVEAFRPADVTVTLTANVIVDSSITDTLTVDNTFGLNPGMTMTYAGIDYVIVNSSLSTATGIEKYSGVSNQLKLNKPIEANIYAGTSVTFSYLPGAFIEDWEFVDGHGTLDRYNGRYCKTPEYPLGTYAYFATQDLTNKPTYPYFIGQSYYGNPNLNENDSLRDPDYITINRSSLDLNAWSRRNRWFHSDVLKQTSLYNNTSFTLPTTKAVRPIIEFKPDLQLFNFGKFAKQTVDVFDTVITHPFNTVEGAITTTIDGILLFEGMRVIFSADVEPRTNGKVYVVTFIDQDNNPTTNKIIHLVEAADAMPTKYETVAVFSGANNSGKLFWYDGTAWVEGQIKNPNTTNQAPLFDVFDIDGISFSDTTKYPVNSSTTAFIGSKLFGYTPAIGTADSVLGFPLSYKNFNNIGDISFTNYFDTDTFSYAVNNVNYVKNINSGFVHKNNADGTYELLNGWHTVDHLSRQYQLFSYIYDGLDSNFNIDVTPLPETTVPNLFVFVNFKQVSKSNYRIYKLANGSLQIWIDQSKLSTNDRVTLKVFSDKVSQNAFFEVPANLDNNAQNQTFASGTLGDLRNHIKRLTENSLDFTGDFPGVSNLRDLDITQKGGTILQHSAPLGYAMTFLTNQQYDFVKSVKFAEQEYIRFKNKFLTLAETGSKVIEWTVPKAVDNILTKINEFKTNTDPWYYSDMVPYGNVKNEINYTVYDANSKIYEITKVFDNTVPSNLAILVYLNGQQLLVGRDYNFLTTGPGLAVSDSVALTVGDTITIVEYSNTDGCGIPETPTKLGLYPSFVPALVTDDTYTTIQTFIRGHDGSLTPAYGDFRDDLLLELEIRIFNNIKVSYDNNLINIYKAKPGKFRSSGFSLAQYSKLIADTYLPWAGFNKLNYTDNTTYSNEDPFSYNYGQCKDSLTGDNLPGSWRACYEYYYDTQRPHTNPWEMLGFSDRPDWWESYYGPAPYAAGNKILWDDLEAGYIAQGPRAGVDQRFARPGLSEFIPVDLNGNLRPPLGLLTIDSTNKKFSSNWLAGQWGPIETAWRNSSNYPYAMQIILALTDTAKYFGIGATTNNLAYNSELKQLVNKNTDQRLIPTDILVNGYNYLTSNVNRSASYINWISDYQTSLGIVDHSNLQNILGKYSINLIYRMAGFGDKKTLKILADQNSPNSINESVIIPDSDFDLILNKSTPTLRVSYSAVIIEKVPTGFKVSGYDNDRPYFGVVLPDSAQQAPTNITVNKYSINWYTQFTNLKVNIPYGTIFPDLQQVANFLAGYEGWLVAQGLRFTDFDVDLGQIRNWQLSAKEFLFWVQQSWAAGAVIILSPFSTTLTYYNATSVVDSLTDLYDGSRIMTQNFQIIGTESYNVVRDNNNFILSLTNASDLIAFATFDLVQFESALIFNNTTQFNDVIYSPESGQRQYRLKLIGTKTQGWTGTLSAQGFIYNGEPVQLWTPFTDYSRGDLVEYKGYYYTASDTLPGIDSFDYSKWLLENKNNYKTGLLPNFATRSKEFEDFYNVDTVNLESDADILGMGLIGFKNRQYLADLGLTDIAQVKFYQGFIKEKGTPAAIDALATINLNNQSTDVQIDEEWAFRVGTYGGLESNKFVDLVLDERYTLNNPTSLEVTDRDSIVYGSTYTNTDGIYNYSGVSFTSPFLLNRTEESDTSNDIKTAGFVNIDDVDHTLFELTDVVSTLSINVDNINPNDTIWVANDSTQDWNVFKIVSTNNSVIKVTDNLNSTTAVTTSALHNLSARDVVLLKGTILLDGLYVVKSIIDNKTFVIDFAFINQNYFLSNSSIYKLISLRIDTPTQITNIPVKWEANDRVWVNNNGNNNWAVYKKSMPWSIGDKLTSGSVSAHGKFGQTVNLNNNFILVGEPGSNAGKGSVVNFVRGLDNQLIVESTQSPLDVGVMGFGSSIASGNEYVAVGAPASNSNTGSVYIYYRDVFGVMSGRQILEPTSMGDKQFGYSIALSKDDQWLYVGAPDEDTVYVYEFDSSVPGFVYVGTIQSPISGIGFGKSLATTVDGRQIAIGAPMYAGASENEGSVYIYNRTVGTNQFELITNVVSPNPQKSSQFGFSIDICPVNRSLFVGVPYYSENLKYQVGTAYRFTSQSTAGNITGFIFAEQIKNPTNHAQDTFGYSLRINETGTVLAIGGPNAYTQSITTFDSSTTFDGGSTRLVDEVKSGAVWTMSLVQGQNSSTGIFVYTQQLDPSKIGITLVPNIGFGTSVAISGSELVVTAPADSSNAGVVYKFNNTDNVTGWDIERQQGDKIDLACILKGFTYNSDSDLIIDHYDFIDPAKGKILGIADQDIRYKSDRDPATYNQEPSLATNSTLYWGEQQVGQVWWDLSTIRFLDYEQDTVKYRTTNWGRLFPGSSVEIYEWVKSMYPPSQYIATGGEGTPRYTDNSYCVTRTTIEPATNQPVVTYYFWVKDKTSVPDVNGRSISTSTIADYIRDPKSSSIKYFAAIKDNAIAVYNANQDPIGSKVVFHLGYTSLINNTAISHSEFTLVSENSVSAKVIPDVIYTKLIDSLSGRDAINNSVPDPALPVSKRYGIEFRPRQSMFIDKNTAMEQLVTYVNNVFSKYTFNVGYNLSTLSAKAPLPDQQTIVNGTIVINYDTTVATLIELSYINVVDLPVGYKVLVLSDSTIGNGWSIYTKNNSVDWQLSGVQGYDVGEYWQPVDWYADYFDQTTQPKYVFNKMIDMAGVRFNTGDVVKILDNGAGKWIILQIFANTSVTIGLQDGTIMLSESLYQQANNGFDNDNFDTVGFDKNTSIEIRYIMDALRNDLFINQLSPLFVDLFFVLVRYVLEEQKSVDWVFKSSFINILHKVKGLTRPDIYFKENQDYHRQYIEEVKPYHTTIREYITDYEASENFNGYVSDFDVPAIYDPFLKRYRSPSGDFSSDASILTQPQYADYLNSFYYTIKDIEVAAGGSGYTIPPTLVVTGSSIGNDAVLRAIVKNGSIVKVQVLYPGSHYFTQPVITVNGGNGSGAVLYALLENTTTRKLTTTLALDRTAYGPSTQTTIIAQVNFDVDGFAASRFDAGGSIKSGVVEWKANTFYLQSSIVVYNGAAYIVNQDFVTGSTFNGNNLSLYKAENFSTANDRIIAYYQPTPGMPNKDVSLLELGIDYSGVIVGDLTFTDTVGPLALVSKPYDFGGFDTSGFDIVSDYLIDTVIESELSDSTLGNKPEDIIIDGGDFVDTYSSHAPEELIPGRIFDTLDISVTTFATLNDSTYQNWLTNQAFNVQSIDIIDGGQGYSTNPTVTISSSVEWAPYTEYSEYDIVSYNAVYYLVTQTFTSGALFDNTNLTVYTGAIGQRASATATVDAAGKIISILVHDNGGLYTTIPKITFTGSNDHLVQKPARAVARLSESNYSTFSFRMFKDLNDNWTYYSESSAAITTLAEDLTITSNTVSVVNSSLLSPPSRTMLRPGVVFINGERIVYWEKDDSTNTLKDVRRGTAGTGADIHLAGSTVEDASILKLVPNTSHTTWVPLTDTEDKITTAGQLYTFSANGYYDSYYGKYYPYTQTNLWLTEGIGITPIYLALETFTSNVAPPVLTTENLIPIISDQFGNAPADGTGLYGSITTQAEYVKAGS